MAAALPRTGDTRAAGRPDGRGVLARLRVALRRVARVRPTRRGAALLVAGAALVGLGAMLALPDVVGLGAAALLAVAASWAALGLQRLEAGRGALAVDRQVRPNPVVRGQRADTALVVAARAPSPAAYERLARLRLSEQAAHELAGREGIRARVDARPERVAVRYAITPTRRGRWTLGPLLTTRTDAFGLVRTTQPLGTATSVAVWPRTTELPVRTGMLGDVEHAASGTRTASPDDSVLREYVAGDDPRRVHWPSAARQGRLMVRSDESAGLRPVTVLLDRALLPATGESRPGALTARADAAGEWAVELVASLATSLLDTGHPVRLVPTSLVAPAEARYVTGPRTGRATLLDATVDLHGLRTPVEAERALLATVQALRVSRPAGEIMVAVVPPLAPVARHQLAALAAEAGACWALVVGAAGDDETLAALRGSGWRAAAVRAGDTHQQAWAALAERGR